MSIASHGTTPELVLLSGMSGAGRSTAAKALEDLGWFVVDNLPPALLPPMVALAARTQGGVPRVAAVVDVRGRDFFADLRSALDRVASMDVRPRLVFLEADDETLIRRFESSRRPHPLQGDGRLVDGIARERELLTDLRTGVDLLIDTSELNVNQLRSKVHQAFSEAQDDVLRLTLISFGYKYGLPLDADMVVDCRFLPNPHWVPELQPHTGLDPVVASYVLDCPDAQAFLASFVDVVRVVANGYTNEGKRYATIAVGCTGGKHRSVAVSEELATRLRTTGVDVHVEHRDLGRE
jgi:UPF0042 nucleotide-binding protein